MGGAGSPQNSVTVLRVPLDLRYVARSIAGLGGPLVYWLYLKLPPVSNTGVHFILERHIDSQNDTG